MVVIRTNNIRANLTGRYSQATVLALRGEQQVVHREHVKAEKFKPKFARPSITDANNVLKEVDIANEADEACIKSLQDLGLIGVFTIVRNGRTVTDAEVALATWQAMDAAAQAAAVANGQVQPVVPALDTVNFFDRAATFTLTELQDSAYYYHCRDADAWVSINALSMELIKNNTKPDLQKSVKSLMDPIPEECRNGPLYLHFIKSVQFSQSRTYVDFITKKLAKFKIYDIQSENVDDAIKTLRNAYNVLQLANSLPPDVPQKLMKIFQTTNNKDFNNVFKSWELNCEVTSTWPTANEIYAKATELYTRACDEKKWLKSKLKASSFLSAGSDNNGTQQDDEELTPEQKAKRQSIFLVFFFLPFLGLCTQRSN